MRSAVFFPFRACFSLPALLRLCLPNLNPDSAVETIDKVSTLR